MLKACYKCKEENEDFTMSAYREVGGGPVVGMVCVDCGQKPTDEEQAEQDKYELAYIESEAINAHPTFKCAEKQVCTCPKHEKNVVYIDSIDGGGDQNDRLDGYYCVTCNSFWREL